MRALAYLSSVPLSHATPTLRDYPPPDITVAQPGGRQNAVGARRLPGRRSCSRRVQAAFEGRSSCCPRREREKDSGDKADCLLR